MSGALTQYEIVNEPAPKRDWNVVVGSELNDIESLTPSKDRDLVLAKKSIIGDVAVFKPSPNML